MRARLGKYCGNGPELWLNIQSAFDLWHARQKLADALDEIPTRAAS
jgi:plasmid maintenance system antidote protein VapI